MSELLLMEGISKRFGGVQALRRVDLRLEAGQVHALIGKNGAGKSTLMKVLAGVHPPDAGTICLRGKEVTISNPQVAHQLGIAIVYQEFSLVPSLTVAENLFLGRLPRHPSGLVDWPTLYRDSASVLARIESHIDPRTPVGILSVAQQQVVEIAKALSIKPSILIMDEPTSALTDQEVGYLFEMIRTLKTQGVGIVYISHRLAEVEQIADYVTILRDGQTVGEGPKQNLSPQEIVRLMVGEQLAESGRRLEGQSGEVVLSVSGLSRSGVLNDISFELHRGEILGIAGLMGARRTELVRALFGLDPIDAGSIEVHGVPVAHPNPRRMKQLGLALAPEDRRAQGLVMGMSVRRNMSLAVLRRLTRIGLLSRAREENLVRRLIRDLDVATADPDLPVDSLSGGNQQKVVLGKWLANEPSILLLDEPTRGIDVGAKAQIFAMLHDLASRGVSVIFISSELEEVLAVAHRILTMYNGRIVAETPGGQADLEHVLLNATGGLVTDVN